MERGGATQIEASVGFNTEDILFPHSLSPVVDDEGFFPEENPGV